MRTKLQKATITEYFDMRKALDQTYDSRIPPEHNWDVNIDLRRGSEIWIDRGVT